MHLELNVKVEAFIRPDQVLPISPHIQDAINMQNSAFLFICSAVFNTPITRDFPTAHERQEPE